MKSTQRLFFLAATVISINLCCCQLGPSNEQSNNFSEESITSISSEPPKVKNPEFITTLPIPNDLKKDNEKKGSVHVFQYDTKIYDINGNGSTTVSKKADVYLPYDYDDNECYDVLYLMHGGGETYTYWLTQNKDTVKVLDNLFASGLVKPCIVVAPTFYTGSSSSGLMNSAATDIFQYEFRNDLVPALEEHYSTYCQEDTSPENLIKTREHRGFAGLSMGSMTSIRSALIGCLDICAYISSMSGGYDASDNTGELGFAKVEEVITGKFKDYPVRYWLNQNGTSDIALTPHEKMKDLILQRMDDVFEEDVNFKWIKFDRGQHDYTSWLVGLYNTLQVFF